MSFRAGKPEVRSPAEIERGGGVRAGRMKKALGQLLWRRAREARRVKKIFHLQPPLYLLIGTRVTDGGGMMESHGAGLFS